MRARDTKVGRRYRFVIEGEVTYVRNGTITINTTEEGTHGYGWNLFNDVQEIGPQKPASWPPQDGDVWVSGDVAYLVRHAHKTTLFRYSAPSHSDAWMGDSESFLRYHPDTRLVFRPLKHSSGTVPCNHPDCLRSVDKLHG